MAEELDLEIVCYTPEQCFYPINYLATNIEPFNEEETCKVYGAFKPFSVMAYTRLAYEAYKTIESL